MNFTSDVVFSIIIYMIQIEVIADLPVGQNLDNHYWARSPSFILDKPIAVTEQDAMSLKTTLQYKLFGSGKHRFFTMFV